MIEFNPPGPGTFFTLESLRDAVTSLREKLAQIDYDWPHAPPVTVDVKRFSDHIVERYTGRMPRIIVSDQAVDHRHVIGRRFPESRHRSRRILKKLIRRHGGEFDYKPASFQIRNTLVIHPTLLRELEAASERRVRDHHDNAVMSALYGVPIHGGRR